MHLSILVYRDPRRTFAVDSGSERVVGNDWELANATIDLPIHCLGASLPGAQAAHIEAVAFSFVFCFTS